MKQLLAIVMLLVLGPISARGNLIVGGSFEAPTVSGFNISIPTIDRYFAPYIFSGWTVESGSVDLVGAYWQAAEGTQSVDLDGELGQSGVIYQDLGTVAGSVYSLTFRLAGNPEGGPAVKGVEVFWGPSGGTLGSVGQFTFDTTGRTVADMGYVAIQVTGLTATSGSMRLRFASLAGTGFGPVIDNVSVNAVPEPGSLISAALGLAALAGYAGRVGRGGRLMGVISR